MSDVEITDGQVAAYDAAWQKSMRNDGIYDLATRAGLAAFCEARDRHVAAKALRDAANVLDSCRRCGQIHQLRVVSKPGQVERRSWASPDDGHAYDRTLPWERDDMPLWLREHANVAEASR